MKYTITIDDRFWPTVHSDWSSLTSEEKRQRKEKFLKDLEVFLNTGSALEDLEANGVQVKNYVQVIHQMTLARDGADLIIAERNEQLQKHGYDATHDDALVNDELVDAAIALLTEDPVRWPEGLDRKVFNNASEKDTVGRFAVAGAFMAAELDRLLRARAANGGVSPAPVLPEAGTLVRARRGLHDRLIRLGVSHDEAGGLQAALGQRCQEGPAGAVQGRERGGEGQVAGQAAEGARPVRQGGPRQARRAGREGTGGHTHTRGQI